MNIKNPPDSFEFFTQKQTCPYFDVSWIDDYDMSWIDKLNEQEGSEKYSKDIDDEDFPLSWKWPADFMEKWKLSQSMSKAKIEAMCATGKRHDCGDETVYLDCEDGNVYFSTPYFAYGDINAVELREDSLYDSLETSANIFINEYREWENRNKGAYDAFNLALEGGGRHTDI